MNISTKSIRSLLLVIIITLLFYVVAEIIFDNTNNINLSENFCSGPHCNNKFKRNRYYDYVNTSYSDYYDYNYDPYYGKYYRYLYDPYIAYNYWYDLWNYLPCVNDVFGNTFCYK